MKLRGRHSFYFVSIASSCLKSLLIMLVGINIAFSKPVVITSFSILEDWVKVLADDFVEVKSIVGPNQDAHIFEPTPQTMTTLLKADLIVAYGFGFENWLDRLKETLPAKKKILYVSNGQEPQHLFDAKVGGMIQDPHGWHDLTRASHNCVILAEALKALLPEQSLIIQKNLQAYLALLKALDLKIRHLFKDLHPVQKIIITSHDGFGYYAAAYGITFLGIMGLSTESQPSAKTFANLIATIKGHGIKRIFLENIANPYLIQQLAEETHTILDGPLYSDALSEKGGPASTFLDLITYNSSLFYQSMKEIRTEINN